MKRYIDIETSAEVEINGTDWTLTLHVSGDYFEQTRFEEASYPEVRCIRAEWWDDEAEEDRKSIDPDFCAHALRTAGSQVDNAVDDAIGEEIAEQVRQEDYDRGEAMAHGRYL